MRRAARTDRNQIEVVKGLRAMGCTVQTLHTIGKGCPDILVGKNHRNILMEIKDGELPPSDRRLTLDELEWHSSWRGQVCIVNSVHEAIQAVQGLLSSGGGGQ